MHDDRSHVQARLRRFTRERLEPAVHPDFHPLRVEHWSVPDEPVPFAEAIDRPYEPTPAGWTWGRAWSSTWFRLSGRLPEGWSPQHTEIVCDLGFTADRPGFQVEGLAYRPDGSILKAVSPRSHHVPLDDLAAARAGDEFAVYVEAAANPDLAGEWTFATTPLGDKLTAGDEPLYRLGAIGFVTRDETAWELLQDVNVLSGLLHELPQDSPRHHTIVRGLEQMLDVVDPDDVAGTATLAREVIAPLLASPAHASSHRIVAVGHAHIDSAWLWPTRETIRKVARTFANALDLMQRHPEFVFAASSAQQYAWLEQHHPALFARVREQVQAGRFVPVGGMWVESDTNMPGGESMVRQFLHGKRFFRERFGIETEEVWLPDSFGYSAALPQIVRGTGNRWFLTQKLSWSQVNRLPHHTFWWEGIDGTRVFTHLPPADTYNSELTPAELLHTERNFKDAGAATTSLVPFGFGDGGGGPTREMLAAAERSRDLEGLPRVEIAAPHRFFTDAEAEYPDAPVWAGEMYLELHRGTYTSQLRTKQGNRRSEQLLHEAELWSATAAVRTGEPYPYDELRRAWENVLLLQFHDILPGSSIAWVHREAERDHARIRDELTAVIDRSVTALVGTGSMALVANPMPLVGAGVDAFAIGQAPETASAVTFEREAGGRLVVDNGVLRAVIDAHGLVVSLIDAVSGREAVAPGGAANRLVLHRDTPNEWDAWDIDDHYRRNATPLDAALPTSLDVISGDDGSVTVAVVRSFGSSRVTQRLRLAPGAPASGPRAGDRLARESEAAEAVRRHRRARRCHGGRDPVRACASCHAREHLVGGGAVRVLRAPLGARRRARLRHGGRQRLDLRARRPPDAANRWRALHHARHVPHPRTPLSRPGGRPGHAHAPCRAAAECRHPGCRGRGLPSQPARAAHRRRPPGRGAVHGRQRDRRGRDGQAGRRRVRRRHPPAVRIGRRPGLGLGDGAVRRHELRTHRSARAPDGGPLGRAVRDARAAAVRDRHSALSSLRPLGGGRLTDVVMPGGCAARCDVVRRLAASIPFPRGARSPY